VPGRKQSIAATVAMAAHAGSKAVRGQIRGGVAQGIGWGLLEKKSLTTSTVMS
jgi:hypothetical protein